MTSDVQGRAEKLAESLELEFSGWDVEAIRDLLALVQQLEAERDEARKDECTGCGSKSAALVACERCYDEQGDKRRNTYRSYEAAVARCATYEAGIARMEQSMRECLDWSQDDVADATIKDWADALAALRAGDPQA